MFRTYFFNFNFFNAKNANKADPFSYVTSSYYDHFMISFWIFKNTYVFFSKIWSFYIVKYAWKWPNFNFFVQNRPTSQIKAFDTILTLDTKRHLKVPSWDSATIFMYFELLVFNHDFKYWTRCHRQMTNAYVINIPAAAPLTAATTTILPNWTVITQSFFPRPIRVRISRGNNLLFFLLQ